MINNLREKIVLAFSRHSAPRWLVLIMDIAAVFVAFYFAYLLRYNLVVSAFNFAHALQHSFLAVGVYTFFILIFRSFSGLIRHTTIKDTFNIFKTTTTAFTTLALISWLSRVFEWSGSFNIPLSILVIHYGSITVVFFFERIFIKMFYEFITTSGAERKNILIYGAGSMGVVVKGVILSDRKSRFKIVGFLDDSKKLHGKNLSGIPVYPPSRLSLELVKKNRIEGLIFAINHLPAVRKSEVIGKSLELGLEVLETPPFENWLNGELQLKQIRKVKIKDLLGRESIKLDMEKIQLELHGKTILVTGAAGSIGSEIVRQLIKFNVKRLILVDQAETPMFYLSNELILSSKLDSVELIIADVTNPQKMEGVFRDFKPDIVFHAAAYKHVPMMEENPHEAFMVNVGGTKNITDLSMKYGVQKFVLISTDKAVNPTNVMGASKRICELYVQIQAQKAGIKTQFVTTRFGNVLGSNGSVIPLFTKQIEEGGPITITHQDVTRYFMTIPEACQLVLEAGFMGKGGEIFVFDMGKPVKIVDLANQMIRLSGLIPGEDIKIAYTGLRSGEKLYEELLSSQENTQPTHHPKILIARVGEVNAAAILSKIEFLAKSLYTKSKIEVVEVLKDLVPEYLPANETYNGNVKMN
jgi:FlaA1/EpsC-like NDP-sugar epimerase